MKQKVFFPCYGGCEFNSLAETVNYVQQMRGGLSVYIDKIVKYNIRFRDCLRENGIDGVIKMLIDEAPAIELETEALDYLKEKWTNRMKEHIADYDIQCLPKDGPIRIGGCLFNGLKEIASQAEMSGCPNRLISTWYNREGYQQNPAGLHIGNIWKSYPTFDSFDDSDGRSYNNYVFSNQPLTEAMMNQYWEQIPYKSNYCMVHEHIPEALLPVLYWDGDSDNVLLATKKV